MKQDIVKDLTTDEIRDKIKDERAGYVKLKMVHKNGSETGLAV